jgi:L-arabinose isomerase
MDLNIGLMGIGLDAYWPQFAGLRERLLGYMAEVRSRLQRPGVCVHDLGLVDTPEKSFAAGHAARAADIDLLVLYVTTYALSSTVLPVVRRARVPVLLLNLSPQRSIDYASFNALGDRTKMTGEWLASCSACPVPEIASVFRRSGIDFHQVTGTLHDDPQCWAEIDGWINAARIASVMEHNRLGLMGHYYSGMLDIYTDVTRQCALFGGHVEMLEVEELSELNATAAAGDVANRIAEFKNAFDFDADCPPAEIERAARCSVALDALVQRHQLGSMAYYAKGTGTPAHEDVISAIILGTSWLTGRGVPVAGEYEVKNVQAMKIMDALGVGGSFTEFYAMDYDADVVLMGHDGPGHIAIAQGRTRVRPLRVYHGKVGRGLSVEMSVRHGPVTLLSVVETREGGLEFLLAEGESVAGPILEIGNTNSRYRFPIGARRFVAEWSARGPAHHCAVGIGHVADTISKLGKLLGIPTFLVC